MNRKTVNVIEGFVHKDYWHTVDLAHFYRQIVTGQHQAELIVNYKPRETEEQKKQRIHITQNRTKSIADKIEGFFKRTFRADKIKFEVTHDNESSQNELRSHIDKFGNDGQSLLNWSEEAALFYNNIDPNSFYWVKHSVLDGVDKFEPFVFSAEDVKDYEIEQGLVKWCVCELSETVCFSADNSQNEKTISIFYNFDSEGLEIAIEINNEVLTHSDFYTQFTDDEGNFIGQLETIKDTSYLVIFEPNESGIVPVSRMGYSHDKTTNKRTYVSFWDGATEEYRQLVNRGSEYDLSLTLHAFLQKISYYTPCDFQDDLMARCEGGILYPSKKTCPSCSGTGKKVHTSSQDVIEIQLPNSDGEPVSISPRDLVHYVELPTEILKQQKEDVVEFEPKITKSIFGVDVSDRTAGDRATATAVNTYNDTAQDILFDFTKSPRRLFLFTIEVMANSLGIEGVGAELLYTNRYDLESEEHLLDLLTKAKAAGAGASVIDNIMDRLSVKQNREDSSQMNVFKALRQFIPFSQVEKDILIPYVLGLPDSSPQKALFFNSKEIAIDIANTVPTFLTMDFSRQKQIVEQKALEYAQAAVNENSVRGIAQIREGDLDSIEGIGQSDD